MPVINSTDAIRFEDNVEIGSSAAHVLIDAATGAISADGINWYLTMRPAIVAGRVGATTKPTPVDIGAHSGYSMPVYNSDQEELFFRDYVPGRWDGATDPIVTIIWALANAGGEDVNDNVKWQLSWENVPPGGVFSATTHDNTALDIPITTGHSAQYSEYRTDFTIDVSLPTPDVAPGDHIGFRLRRIDATDPDITGECIVYDVLIKYKVDKVFKSS